MPVSLAALTSQTADITLVIGDAEIAATYYPDRISGADLKRLFTLQAVLDSHDAERVLDAIDDCARFLAHVLASWELVEEDGGPVVPITEERLLQFGAFIIGALVGSFLGALRLGEPNGNGSPAPSPPTRTNRSRKSSRRN